jgi:hypothetical protein
MSDAPQFTVPMPMRMRGLRRDHRGFAIPFFVAWLDDDQREVTPPEGTPDFRILSPGRMRRCKRERLCWLCGHKLGRHLTFAIGPMCAVTRTTMEPPGHLDCARYSVQVCPFLSRPKMRRNDGDMPEGHWAPGISIDRNPGVTALWTTTNYTTFQAGDHHTRTAGELITVGEPEHVEWWREGRFATRAEVMASVDSGLPALRKVADDQSADARRDLDEHYIPRFMRFMPS